MKRRDLDRQIGRLARSAHATVRLEHGARHDKMLVNGVVIPLPRHSEIGETLARTILKQVVEALK